MSGPARRLRYEPEPYLVQHDLLTLDQLLGILDNSSGTRIVVTQVPEPKAGQVYLVDCAGARFARYDSHRWKSYHHHSGLGLLAPPLPPPRTDPLEHLLEVRYNKKRGGHGTLPEGAVRVIYKPKTESVIPGTAVTPPPLPPFYIIQYLDALPPHVEAAITSCHRAEEEARALAVAEEERKKEEEERRRALEEARIGASKFGRRRKPNSRYSGVYTLDSALDHNQATDDVSDDDTATEDSTRDTVTSSDGSHGTRVSRKGPSASAEGFTSAGHQSSVTREAKRVWLAGYGIERIKPKSSLLFRMCDESDSDESDGDGGGDGVVVVKGQSEEESEEEEEEEEEEEQEEKKDEMFDLHPQIDYDLQLATQTDPNSFKVKIPAPFDPDLTSEDPIAGILQRSEVIQETAKDADPARSPSEEVKEERKRKTYKGRPRYRGMKKRRKKKEEEEKEEFDEDEVRPFTYHTRGRLYHADAEDIFRQADKGKLEVLRKAIRHPRPGGLYLLDKSFVPYSDSMPWVRDYYYRSHNISMERFELRDHQSRQSTSRQSASRQSTSRQSKNKTLFTYTTPLTTLCLVHYHKTEEKKKKLNKKTEEEEEKKEEEEGEEEEEEEEDQSGMETFTGVYTESNSNLNLTLVEAMLTRPDLTRVVEAPVLNPQPFQVYLISVPAHNTSKVLDNYKWTHKGFKRWPAASTGQPTRLLCHHRPMRLTKSSVCPALMRHEFRLATADAEDLRVLHYMPTREFREFVVISNAVKQMQRVTQNYLLDTGTTITPQGTTLPPHGTPLGTLAALTHPLRVSGNQLSPAVVWEMLTETSTASVVSVDLVPQPGGVYLASTDDSVDQLTWVEIGQLAVQPRLFQLVEVCQVVVGAQPALIRLRYTSTKVPHRVILHYLGDTRPYLWHWGQDSGSGTHSGPSNAFSCGQEGEGRGIGDGDRENGEEGGGGEGREEQEKEEEEEEIGRKIINSDENEIRKKNIGHKRKQRTAEAGPSGTRRRHYLRECRLYRINRNHLAEVGCPTLRDEDLDVEMELPDDHHNHHHHRLTPPDKPGIYYYGGRMLKKRVVRMLENLDPSRVTTLPIRNPEAGEAYLVTRPSSSKTPLDPYKWTHKGWQPIPRKDPIVVWRLGVLRYKRHTFATPLLRVEYTHLHAHTDLMVVHYLPTKDNAAMLDVRSAVVPVREGGSLTHTLLSAADVNYGQDSQLLTNSPLPAHQVWEILGAGGGLSHPIEEPQPGGVYVINRDFKDKLDIYPWRTLGNIRLSSNDYGLLETSSVIQWAAEGGCGTGGPTTGTGGFGRLLYHSDLIKNRTVIHYLGDCRPYLEKAKAENEQPQLQVNSSAVTLDLSHLEVTGGLDGVSEDRSGRDAATEAVGSILAGLGSNIMDSDALNQTFADLGGEVEGLCDTTNTTNTTTTSTDNSTRLEDTHLQDSALPPIQVTYGSVSTNALVSKMFPEGLPLVQKVVEEEEVISSRRRRLDNILELPGGKEEEREGEREREREVGPYRAIPRTLQDWTEEEEIGDDISGGGGGVEPRPRFHITTTETRTILYLRQHHRLSEKQLDHFLCNPDVSRVSFLPLVDPQAGDVYVVAMQHRKGELRRLDCHSWYMTGQKTGKFRRSYSYIRDAEGNYSHRLVRYTYDYAWEDAPGLRVVHYLAGDPRHTVLCCGKKPNYEEEAEVNGPLYRAYTASLSHRDVLQILNDRSLFHACELPIRDPKAGDVYIVKASSILAAGQQEGQLDNLSWSEGQVRHVGSRRLALQKTRYLSYDPSDGTRSDSFLRVTWQRVLDPSEVTTQLRGQPLVIVHYLGDESMAGEMVRRGKDGMLHLRQVRHYIETGTYLPSVHNTEKNGIRKSAKKFTLQNNLLYYTGKDRTEMRLVLYTAEEKNKAFRECHIMPKTAAHCGRTKTLNHLSEKYYWTNMVEDVVAMIVRCKSCEMSKVGRPNQRYVRVKEPWEVVSVDIVGQFTTSGRGNVSVAVIIDMFTKYTLAVPLRDTTIDDLAGALQGAVFQQGPPRMFISDQREAYVDGLSFELQMRVGVSVMAVNKMQLNRPDEAKIKATILNHCLEGSANWDETLPRKIYEINSGYVTASSFCPFTLMYNRKARPLDGSLSLPNCGIRPTFVVPDIAPFLMEREQQASEMLTQVLTGGQPTTESTEIYLEDDSEGVGGVDAGGGDDACGDDGGGGGGGGGGALLEAMEVVPDSYHQHHQDRPPYTQIAHLPDTAQVLDEAGGSVYEIGDGGHVVVVPGGVAGLDVGGEGEEVGEQHMVVVQPGVGDQGVIMLENHVIMEAVAGGRQFTYLAPPPPPP
ncbi:uncharacterized protein LOC127010127 [Eriocheir sinensis]|uniref:uncharacterized protein LOC127010127 n=1 Tax=Eriocheir sinensis TaxID=95602 RepID=UPI0021C7CBE7|nr:uncharacterized protein LOC127010127 [Eriocheir sinensis]